VQLKKELNTLETEMENYLKELGYDVQDAQVPRAQGCAGAAGAGGVE
jgi:type I restriction enzyme M protein